MPLISLAVASKFVSTGLKQHEKNAPPAQRIESKELDARLDVAKIIGSVFESLKSYKEICPLSHAVANI